jgi:two-component system, chemotaxis family, chemotaxis protein CheY
MKILVVDDSKAMRMIVVRTLRQIGFVGHEIVEAEDGLGGLAALANGGIDLVLADWNMPVMNGFELLVAVRAAGNAIPFGFVTAASSPSMRERAADAGATFFIAKPFTMESFRDAVRVAIPVAA